MFSVTAGKASVLAASEAADKCTCAYAFPFALLGQLSGPSRRTKFPIR